MHFSNRYGASLSHHKKMCISQYISKNKDAEQVFFFSFHKTCINQYISQKKRDRASLS